MATADPAPNPAVERRALTLFELLAERPGDPAFRERLIAQEPDAVRARVLALEASVARATGAFPTLLPDHEPSEPAPPPERVGHFRLRRLLGRGGMGEVWLGERDDGLYQQQVAIKLIQRHALSRAAAAFGDERRFLARLEHPSIARLIDGGVTDDGLPWLAMEYVEGRPIDAACDAQPLRTCVALLLDACEAVRFAHGRLVAHGDVKPANILVTAAGRVKLLDFGIARLIDGDDASGPAPFTPEFASPERQAGRPPSVADDVFALGRTLAALIAHQPDAELAAIVARACATAPERRYATVDALAAELAQWRDGLPVAAMGRGAGYRAAKFVRRHRRAFAAGLAATTLLATTGGVAANGYLAAQRERAVAAQRFDQVRRLSRYMLFTAYDDLARKPGTVEERERLVATATTYMAQLQVTAATAPALRQETAQSYRRLAAVQGLATAPGPADRTQALTTARRLLEAVLTQTPDDVPALTELGAVHADLWTLDGGADAAGNLPRAERLLDRALRLAPGDPAALLQRLRVEYSRGVELIYTRDRPAEARPLLERTLRRLRAVGWPAALRGEADVLEATLLNRIGDANWYLDDYAGSLRPYEESRALVDAEMRRDGVTPQRLALQADNLFDISGSLAELPGRRADALAAARELQPTLLRILETGPDAVVEKKLLVLYGQEAEVLDLLGRPTDALAVSRASIALRQVRLRRMPADLSRQRDLAVGLTAHANIANAAGKRAEACRAAGLAHDLWENLQRRGRLDALDARRGLPQSGTARKSFCPT